MTRYRQDRRLIVVTVCCLNWFCITVRPRSAAADDRPEFYRGINLNGPALTIDEHPWEADDAHGVLTEGLSAFDNQSVLLIPATDDARARMIRSSRWSPQKPARLRITDVPAGTYSVYLYVWEDNDPEKFDIHLAGKRVVKDYNSGNSGHWDRLGPWVIEVTDGTIELSTVGGHANLSGLEIWHGKLTEKDNPLKSFAPPVVTKSLESELAVLLARNCLECHNAADPKGGLDLSLRDKALAGGDSGAVLKPGDPDNSLLVERIESGEMPPKERAKLSAGERKFLRDWVKAGAKWPEGASPLRPARKELVVTDEHRRHWAFQPLRPVEPPQVNHRDAVRTPIDQFILAALEAKGLHVSAPASSRTLMRRVSFDVIGLPPEPQEAETFCESADRDSRAALEQLVDRLLDSRHYGERWGRHWLDVARYADSDGQETDRDRPLAYHYRDFVIRALNEDMPFDRFVRWQIAGNEYEPDNPAAVAATGFLAAGPFAGLGDNLLEEERLRNRYNELDDIVSTIGTGLLGLTLGCVRCHDHKYDAIPARDYYSILGTLHSGDRGEVTLASKDKVYAYRDASSEPKPTWLFHRGDFYDHEQSVPLGFVSVLTREKAPETYWHQARENSPAKDSTLQRRALAEWLTDVEQGAGALVARVIVNRIWQHHFGEALVRTVGDFGVRSEPPTHPELLEWLAHDLVQHGWKLKRLHRLILTSAVFQQASVGRSRTRENSDRSLTTSATASDPDNRQLWKMRPRRLEAEILRDAMLAVSGTLNREQFGPGFKPPISSEAMVARNTKDPYPAKIEDSAAVRRRSVYMFHKRVVPYPLLQAFDKPDAQQSCNRRDPTTVAPQALALLNDQFVRTVALDFANRLIKEFGGETPQWIERGYQLALSRSPSESERNASLEFVQGQIKERTRRAPQSPPEEIQRRALADLCQAWFSLNEFLYID